MRTGRNQPCPCGSGKKYKHCHGRGPNLWSGPPPGAGGAGCEPIIQRGSLKKLRECDGCTACCGPTLQINDPELTLPKGETCPHVGEHGCSRWGPAQPKTCRAYLCNYLVEPALLTIDDRPDKVGAIFHRKSDGKTLLVESLPGGLLKILKNRVWGSLIRNNLLQGRAIQATFLDDPYNAEGVEVKRLDCEIRCALALRHADRSPILVPEKTIGEKKLYRSPFIRIEEFSFDLAELIQILSDRESILITCPNVDSSGRTFHFLFTRRQADFLHALLALAGPQGSWGEGEAEGQRKGDERHQCVKAALADQ